MENRMIILECPNSGIPFSSVIWLKDEQPIFPRSDLRIQLLSGPPQMNDADRLIHVREGVLLILSCPVQPFPQPLIIWTKNGQVLDSNFINVMILPEKFALKIMGSRASDSGVYKFIATNQAGEGEAMFDVEVLVPSKIKRPSTSIHNVIKGQSITLQCLIDGNPIPRIKWFKDGIPLNKEEEKGLIPELIMEIHGHDFVGPQRGDISLDEYGNINHSSTAHKTPVYEACKYKGQPSTVKKKSGHKSTREINLKPEFLPVENPTESARIKILQEGSLLIVENSTLNDSGEYSCVASNDVGTDEYQFKVNVIVPQKIFIDKRKLLQRTSLKEKVVLNCFATGIPKPRIIWYKDSQPLGPNPGYQFSPQGDFLTIISAKLSDNSKYSCIAMNEAGEDEAYFIVLVLEPPTIDEIKLLSGSLAIINSSVKLECVVHGIPRPSIFWFKNKAIMQYGFDLEQHKYLEFSRVTLNDAGVYTCYAENAVGNATKHFTLNILIPPNINGEKTSSEINVQVATPLNLTCPATGQPKQEITWIKSNINLSIRKNSVS